MKKAIYIFICFIWFSCANDTKNKSETLEDSMEAIPIAEDDDLEVITYEGLATQKLIEYFDLIRLKQEHPEFEKDIILQLQMFSNDSTSINSYEKIDSVKNIRQNGVVKKESDSVQKMKLYFDVVLGNHTQSDSILAIITTKSILLDDETVDATKVLFKKLNR